MKLDSPFRSRTPILLVAMLSLSGIATSVRADRAENAFVVVEGDGVVRLDGRNFMIDSSAAGGTPVTVSAQPGWTLLSASSANVTSDTPLRYMVRDSSREGSGSGTVSNPKASFVMPAGDPVNRPVDSGDGQNEFTFSTATTGILTINLKVKLEPALSADKAPEGFFSMPSIGNSAKRWNVKNPDGKAVYFRGFYTATITYRGLPLRYDDFGKNTVEFKYGDKTIRQVFEVFYPAWGYNHPDDGHDYAYPNVLVPNWFFYYKQNAGGGDYMYFNGVPSDSHSGGGEASIFLGNDAFENNHYLKTKLKNGRLAFNGNSDNFSYYANFCGVLAHERFHANCQSISGELDSDGDCLADSFELNTSKTDPTDANSAWNLGIWSNTNAKALPDNEVYAGGPVEKTGIETADTSRDWANPGSNSKREED